MITEINGWRTHHPTNIAISQYQRGPNELLLTMAWKPEGYDRLGELNRFRLTHGLKPVGDRNTLLETDPEYGSPGFYVLVNMNGKPATIFLSDHRDQGALHHALKQHNPQDMVDRYIINTRREQA